MKKSIFASLLVVLAASCMAYAAVKPVTTPAVTPAAAPVVKEKVAVKKHAKVHKMKAAPVKTVAPETKPTTK